MQSLDSALWIRSFNMSGVRIHRLLSRSRSAQNALRTKSAPVTSVANSGTAKQQHQQQQQQQQQHRHHPSYSTSTKPSDRDPESDVPRNSDRLPELPEPSQDAEKTRTVVLDLSSGRDQVSLEHLGPVVVNRDGTVGRVGNWGEMTGHERAQTLLLLKKRNMLRREDLARLGGEGGVAGTSAGSSGVRSGG